jgi:hypothetical protein
MATVLGGIAGSHTPTIGFAYDKRKQDDPVWTGLGPSPERRPYLTM